MTLLPKVSIITFAYNAEKYIRKCADSVLNQSFSDIEWLVVNNGSTDSTGMILEEYQKKDSRVKIYQNKENSHMKNADYKYKNYHELILLANGEYFTTLDSDDFFELNFVEEMYKCAKENDSDIVICGNNFIQESTGNNIGSRFPPDYIGDVSGLCQKIPEFYACLRPAWEKMYKTRVWKQNTEYITNSVDTMKNGGDTFMVLRYLQVSKKVSSLSKVLHNYLIRESSAYHSFIYCDRWKSYDILFIEGLSLLTKHSAVTNQNLKFLSAVHINSLIDLIDVAKKSTVVSNEKIQFLLNTANSPMFSLCMNYIPSDLIFKFINEWFNVIWSVVKQAVIADDLETDLKLQLLDYLDRVSGKEHLLQAIMIGKVLSASVENKNSYIKYSKMLIAFFIDNNKMSDAKNALMEIYDILPDDPDLIQYSQLIS